jgi:DNA-binding NarL/FixJ family response regulator
LGSGPKVNLCEARPPIFGKGAMPNVRTTSPRGRIRIVIVEEYDSIRATLHDLVGRAPDFSIAGEVVSVKAAIDLLRADPADVVLVDTRVAVVNVVAALQRLKHECPGSPIVLLGHRADDDEVFQAIRAGASAYLLNTVRAAELLKTIRRVASGEYLIDTSVAARPELARRVLEAFRDAAVPGLILDAAIPPSTEQLSDRETEILERISEGLSNKQIGSALLITPAAVRVHVRAILRKLAANNRTNAVLFSLDQSWIRLPDRRRGRPN